MLLLKGRICTALNYEILHVFLDNLSSDLLSAMFEFSNTYVFLTIFVITNQAAKCHVYERKTDTDKAKSLVFIVKPRSENIDI